VTLNITSIEDVTHEDGRERPFVSPARPVSGAGEGSRPGRPQIPRPPGATDLSPSPSQAPVHGAGVSSSDRGAEGKPSHSPLLRDAGARLDKPGAGDLLELPDFLRYQWNLRGFLARRAPSIFEV
jgi:hypothetical protein